MCWNSNDVAMFVVAVLGVLGTFACALYAFKTYRKASEIRNEISAKSYILETMYKGNPFDCRIFNYDKDEKTVVFSTEEKINFKIVKKFESTNKNFDTLIDIVLDKYPKANGFIYNDKHNTIKVIKTQG